MTAGFLVAAWSTPSMCVYIYMCMCVCVYVEDSWQQGSWSQRGAHLPDTARVCICVCMQEIDGSLEHAPGCFMNANNKYHIYVHEHKHTYVYIYTHTHNHKAFTFSGSFMNASNKHHTYVHTHACTHTHTHTHAHTRIHTQDVYLLRILHEGQQQVHRDKSVKLTPFVCVCVCVYVCMYIYIYIYIYTNDKSIKINP